MNGTGNIKVVVRCRPLSSKEMARGATSLVRMKGNQTILQKPALDDIHSKEDELKAFTFDKSYWSGDKHDPQYADQQTVYNDLGRELLDHAFHGYNCCIFAYGQTGSGKSYTMMGYGADKGLIPLSCSELFERITQSTSDVQSFEVEVSYMEIYNEKVRDLLNPRNKGNLRVREHPSLGPYVEDLSRLAVKSFEDIDHLMTEGNKARTVASTNMNETSSRSHAVFTIFLTCKNLDTATKLITEKASRISLVDLAGSERADSTGATGLRLKEGANINRSLTALGNVISKLAEYSTQDGKKHRKGKEAFVPYRDSILTWLLKDSLGGNSKTTMIAAISPADYEETLSTLRYADQAKKIKNKAMVNEDPNAKLIRELKEELQMLRQKLYLYAPEEAQKLAITVNSSVSTNKPTMTSSTPLIQHKPSISHDTREEMVDQFHASEKLLKELNQTWEEKLHRTQEIHNEREKSLEELGIMVEKDNMGVYMPKNVPHLLNLNEDPLMSECLMYPIKPGITRVGGLNRAVEAEIRLSGSNILDEHCYFQNSNETVTIHPLSNSLTMVNGRLISEPRSLHSGFRIILGGYHVFRFNHPQEARKERNLQLVPSTSADLIVSDNQSLRYRPASISLSWERDTRVQSPDIVDWNFARREAVLNYYNTDNPSNGLSDDTMEKLFSGIFSNIGHLRKRRPESRTEIDDDSLSRASMSSAPVGTLSTAATVLDDPNDQLVADSISAIVTDTESLLRLAKDELQHQFELQRQEYQDKIRQLELANAQKEDQDKEKVNIQTHLQEMKEEMQRMLQHQKTIYESKIKRLSNHLPPNVELNSPLFSPLYAVEDRALALKTMKQWKQQRYAKMAETVLKHAVTLKEVNVISKELEKHVVYQFTIVHDDHFAKRRQSFWESKMTMQMSAQPVDPALMTEPKPCVAVLVLDQQHHVMYLWSLEKLQQQLDCMRPMYDLTEEPLDEKDSRPLDPFYPSPSPIYSLVGLAKLPLRNLLYHKPLETEIQVFCGNTAASVGHLKVKIVPLARSLRNQRLDDDACTVSTVGSNRSELLRVGQQQVFEVHIIELNGLSETHYTQVHVQFRLSEFGAAVWDSLDDRIYVTDPVSDFADGPIKFHFSQTLSLTVDIGILNTIVNDGLILEVFGRVQPHYLEDIASKSVHRRKCASPSIASSNDDGASILSLTISEHATVNSADLYPVTTMDIPSSQVPSTQHPFAQNLSLDQRHDVVAWIQICELTAEGQHTPVDVVSQSFQDNVFLLRQGVQRRLVLTLVHDSGAHLPWKEVCQVTMGNPRLVDAKGSTLSSEASSEVGIPLLKDQQLTLQDDGVSTLTVQGTWDSSLHDADYLNRITATNCKILLDVGWQIQCESPVNVLPFKMTIAVQIRGRDGASTSTSMFRQLIGTQRILHKQSGCFAVHLKPSLTHDLRNLWRFNTANQYVRGEELLGKWRPRSVSLVNEYRLARKKMLWKQEVEDTRHTLCITPYSSRRWSPTPRGSLQSSNLERGTERDTQLIESVLNLWTKKASFQQEMVLSEHPLPETYTVADSKDRSPVPRRRIKLIPKIERIMPNDKVTKKGPLLQWDAPHDEWLKHYFVLRRPLLIIYDDSAETEEVSAVNLDGIRIEYNNHRETEPSPYQHTFTIYTKNNSYLLQAASHTEMVDWISKIDQFYPIDTLS
ncbi:uncharacterized protein BYT42DRAFT_571769 [Radiomyces spectabilis]|uniref:uncharacterized protein n=1 Tax=Radiomyces spectabilis TaxID=64574 RepID=UPI00221EB461|nr:uncharacterized protein BYT42DRAFT_571769 [Radiomyces spectabilis]KAI8377808.1 hypothetical protein BYT42DRAFT_571769 [Radiomyces spectabilis]